MARPKSPPARHTRVFRLLGGLLAVIVLYELLFPLPRVRIDSGDRRSGLLLGPIWSRVTGREDLIAAAAELGIPAEWHRLRGAPSNAEAQRVILYSKTAFWLQAEPPLGKRIFRDVADYYSGRADYKQIAGWYEILHAVEYSPRTQSLYVDFGRVRDVASLRTSLAAVGYVPVPDGPVDRALRVSPAP